jgi:hypothetical protein
MAENNDPGVNRIPKERLNYMIEAATAIRLQDKVTPIQFKTILLNSYTTNSNLMGMYLQDDLMNRAEQYIQSWEPDNTFWANVSEVLEENDFEKLKKYYSELPADSEDFKYLKHILHQIKLNNELGMSDLRDRFDNYNIGIILLKLYSNKKEKEKLFGGKRKKSRKGRKNNKVRKSSKARKSRKEKKSGKAKKSRKGK